MAREFLYVSVFDPLESNLKGRVRFDKKIKFTPEEIDMFGHACDTIITANGTWSILNGYAPDVRRNGYYFTNEGIVRKREDNVLITGYCYEKIG